MMTFGERADKVVADYTIACGVVGPVPFFAQLRKIVLNAFMQIDSDGYFSVSGKKRTDEELLQFDVDEAKMRLAHAEGHLGRRQMLTGSLTVEEMEDALLAVSISQLNLKRAVVRAGAGQ